MIGGAFAQPPAQWRWPAIPLRTANRLGTNEGRRIGAGFGRAGRA